LILVFVRLPIIMIAWSNDKMDNIEGRGDE
jgi:hypothetical protein